MAITITELEMALDASNKSNGQLQMTAKGQAEKIMQLMQLTAAYNDIQKNKLRVEVEQIKKMMAITITELEMALDTSNKSNGQLKMTAKGQAEKIMQLTPAYNDIQKKLGGSV